jgi:hypothetical protein
MKYLLLLLLTLNLTFSFSQSKEGYKEITTSTVYMIDESWKPKGSILWPTEGNTSYVQIVSGEYFVISYRIRGRDYYFEGDIEDWVYDDYKLNFWVRGRDLSGGKPVLSFSLLYDVDKKHVHMHLYNTLGKFDNYYSGHLASQEEIQKLLEYDRKK